MLNQVVLVGRLKDRLDGYHYHLDVDGTFIPLRLESGMVDNIIAAGMEGNDICGVKGKIVVEWGSPIVQVEKITYLSSAQS